MSQRERERAILDIVDDQPISTQSGLVRALGRRGFEITQATVSRDVRRLGLVKVRAADGSSRYARAGATPPPTPAARRVLQSTLREFATDFAVGGGLFAIKTHSGCANAVGNAMDEAEVPGVVATLAGDDTIFVLTRNAGDRPRVISELQALMREA
jgi:transcriptional regulator of arginine metabolism